jgi:anti-anti-sigma factor
MDLDVKLKEMKPGMFNVGVTGRIDTETHAFFQKKLQPIIDKKAKNVLVDMAGVTYISSAGLSAIFQLMKKLKESGGELLLCNLQPQIRKVFDIIKALPTTNIFASVKEADAYLAHIQDEEIQKRRGSGAS